VIDDVVGNIMNTINKTRVPGFIIYVVAALAFLVLMAMNMGGIGRTVLKAIPVSTLLIFVLRDMRGFVRICLVGALLCSVCGDILLDLPYTNVFIVGLVAFLVGHLFYTVLFFRHAKSPDGFGKLIIAVLVIFSGVMIWIFRGISPALFGPVVLYVLVIITMSIGALLVPAETHMLFRGTLLFIASDVVLAVNKFLFIIPYGRVINISLYFIAQFIIIMAARTIWVDMLLDIDTGRHYYTTKKTIFERASLYKSSLGMRRS
jgi:uncharacterized membrane protein YhhN